MAQRILKCIICGGPHSIFHCVNKCVVCNGEKRECSCPEQPPQKKQKKQSSSQPSKQSSAESSSYKELRKLYDNLQKEHERVGTAFQNQQKQQEELEKELDEATKDAEELANLVRTKLEAIKTLQNKLAQAKKTIAELKAENQTLRNNAPQTPQQQQQSGRQLANSRWRWAVLHFCQLFYLCDRSFKVTDHILTIESSVFQYLTILLHLCSSN